MNKYFVKIPYSYTQYAELSGFVYANDSEEANELASETWNIHDQEHLDTDSSGDSEYSFDEMSVVLEESDIPIQDIPARNNSNPFSGDQPDLPNYFLEELPALASL